MKYKIKHDESACIGCGVCASICPSHFALEGLKAKVIKETVNEDELTCVKDAADNCPVQCIKIEKE